MPQRTFRYLTHPFKYPEWAEMVLATVGILQFVFAMFLFGDPALRPAYEITIYLSPEAWYGAGLALFILHISFISVNDPKLRYRLRAIAAGSSLVFWTHFVLSIVVMSVCFGQPFPGTIVPALAAPIFSGAVLYRLWRMY